MELRLASHEVAIGLQGGFVLEDLSQYNPRAFHRNPNSSSLVQNFDEFCPSTVSPLIVIVMEPRRSWRPGRQWRALEVFTKLGSRSQTPSGTLKNQAWKRASILWHLVGASIHVWRIPTYSCLFLGANMQVNLPTNRWPLLASTGSRSPVELRKHSSEGVISGSFEA